MRKDAVSVSRSDAQLALTVLCGLATLILFFFGAGDTESGKSLLEGAAVLTVILIILHVL